MSFVVTLSRDVAIVHDLLTSPAQKRALTKAVAMLPSSTMAAAGAVADPLGPGTPAVNLTSLPTELSRSTPVTGMIALPLAAREELMIDYESEVAVEN